MYPPGGRGERSQEERPPTQTHRPRKLSKVRAQCQPRLISSRHSRAWEFAAGYLLRERKSKSSTAQKVEAWLAMGCKNSYRATIVSLVQHSQTSMHMLRMTAIFQNRELRNSLLLTFSASERASPTTIQSEMKSRRSRIQA